MVSNLVVQELVNIPLIHEPENDNPFLVGIIPTGVLDIPVRVILYTKKIDEMIIHATLLRAGLEAALMHAHSTPEGFFYPDDMYTNVTKYQGAMQFNTMVRHLHDIAGGAVVTAPSMSDFDNETLRPFLEKYMATGDGITGEYRTRLFHAIRDTTADSYGGWHQVTNIQSGGGLFAQRLVTRRHYDMDRAKALALHAAGISGA